ncbi:MAG: tRNA-dihydrouridine synthase [Candidatus Coatesbacteria bacterium]|nr:tRNA-dihydrouridine synthase [Candidatus Coatesbacteria bacterium]
MIDYIFSKSKLGLAPMSEINNKIFRQICKYMGAYPVFTGMISSDAITRNHANSFQLAEFDDYERPLGVQLFGYSFETVSKAGQIINERLKPDFIDFNSGCPVRKVVKKNSGAALLKDLKTLNLILKKLHEAVKPTPVTVKIRSGWSRVNLKEIIRAVEDSGIEAIILHPRLAVQGYEGNASYDLLKEAVSSTDLPIIASGDIDSFEKAVFIMNSTSCFSVLVGREARSNPFIFTNPYVLPDDKDRISVALLYLLRSFLASGEKAFWSSKPYCAAFTKGISHGAELRRNIFQSSSFYELYNVLHDKWERLDESSYPEIVFLVTELKKKASLL